MRTKVLIVHCVDTYRAEGAYSAVGVNLVIVIYLFPVEIMLVNLYVVLG